MSESHSTVVHVSTVHHWDDSRIFRRMCLSLARHGYDVVLLAVAEREQSVDGVRIVPVPAARNRLARLLLTLPRVARQALGMRADVYQLHDPELIPLIPLLRLRGAKVIYDAHEDLVLQVLEKEYLPRRIRPAVAAIGGLLCRFADRTADHVLAASSKVAERYDAATCTVVRNYPEELSETISTPDYRDRGALAVYAGGLTIARGVVQMVDAMPLAGLDASWRLLLVGPHSPDDLIDRLRKRPGWDLVSHRTVVPPNEARRLMANCRIGLALLQPIGQNVDVQPTKLFEYMSLGIPVVAANYPECRRVVEGTGCGLLVDPTDPEAIGAAISYLATHPDEAEQMGRRGREAVATGYSWSTEEKRMLEAYSLLRDSGSPAGTASRC